MKILLQRQSTDSVKLSPKCIFCDKATIKKDYKKRNIHEL